MNYNLMRGALAQNVSRLIALRIRCIDGYPIRELHVTLVIEYRVMILAANYVSVMTPVSNI